MRSGMKKPRETIAGLCMFQKGKADQLLAGFAGAGFTGAAILPSGA